MTREHEGECIGCRGDTTVAVRHHAALVENRRDGGAQLVHGQQSVRSPVDEPTRGHAQAARDMAAPRPVPLLARELLRRDAAHQRTGGCACNDRRDLGLVRPEFGAFDRLEACGRRLDVAHVGLAALGRPLGVTAIEHCDVVIAERSEQPPDARGPLADRAVVDDDRSLVVDAERTRGGGEPLGRGPGERVVALGIGEFLDHVREHGCGHVPAEYVALVAAHVAHTTGGQRGNVHRGIQDYQVVGSEVIGEPLGRDDGGVEERCSHVFTLERARRGYARLGHTT